LRLGEEGALRQGQRRLRPGRGNRPAAQGEFKHGQHLAFDPAKAPPPGNLYVSLLRRPGVAADKFGSGTGTRTGIDLAPWEWAAPRSSVRGK
jgi:hypothetical protein